MTAGFKDHFSEQSEGYARYRPTYPDELFEFLASINAGGTKAWDCATGSGQCAIALTQHYLDVVATDASDSQIDAAAGHPGIQYRVATAEQSGFDDDSMDLITVAQAFHWFDHDGFFAEARRVLRADGVLAIWCYAICETTVACDALIDTLYCDIVGEFWPPEREMIESGYDGVSLPGEPVAAPEFKMIADWRVGDMLGYLRTWSACKRYEAANDSDPVAQIEAALMAAWGEGTLRVSWPLHLRVSRANTLLE